MATRKASLVALNAFAPALPELVGGSADLTGSNLTKHDTSVPITGQEAGGNYIYFGVREFGMTAIGNGMALHGGVIPYSGTFLVFSDYARNALRMAALMKVRNILVMGHASCGGVKACLAGAEDPAAGGRFIAPWVSILAPARDEVLRRHAEASVEALQRAMELAGIQQSLVNLKTFPFVAEALAAGELRLQGAYFSIATGELSLLDPVSGGFETVD